MQLKADENACFVRCLGVLGLITIRMEHRGRCEEIWSVTHPTQRTEDDVLIETLQLGVAKGLRSLLSGGGKPLVAAKAEKAEIGPFGLMEQNGRLA